MKGIPVYVFGESRCRPSAYVERYVVTGNSGRVFDYDSKPDAEECAKRMNKENRRTDLHVEPVLVRLVRRP